MPLATTNIGVVGRPQFHIHLGPKVGPFDLKIGFGCFQIEPGPSQLGVITQGYFQSLFQGRRQQCLGRIRLNHAFGGRRLANNLGKLCQGSLVCQLVAGMTSRGQKCSALCLMYIRLIARTPFKLFAHLGQDTLMQQHIVLDQLQLGMFDHDIHVGLYRSEGRVVRRLVQTGHGRSQQGFGLCHFVTHVIPVEHHLVKGQTGFSPAQD